jgi:ribosomal protein S18 acetylase RimI-like enzyme
MTGVRRLGPGDEDELRAVRLAALTADPDVFGSTLDRERGLGPADWTRRLTPPSTAFVVAEPAAGMAWGVPDAADAAVAHLYGMWVRADLRGTGAADDLIGAVVAWTAEQGRSRLQLTVLVGNERAEALYVRHGFARTGTFESRPRDGREEAQMVLVVPDPTEI